MTPRRSGDAGLPVPAGRHPAVIAAALAASAAAVLAAGPAVGGGGAGGSVAGLPGVPAARLLAHGRVLVLRPHRLEVAVDGSIRRDIPVTQPLDLARLPAILGDPAFASSPGPGVVRLGAVLVQRPETVVAGGGDGIRLRLELDDTGGAGPARITGTRASLRLHGVDVVTAGATSGTPATGPADPAGATDVAGVAAGLRYLHQSDVELDDVTLDGLGGTGRSGLPALRTDGGGRVRLHAVRVVGRARGITVEDAVGAEVDGFVATGLAGDALVVAGGSGARITGVRAEDLAAAGVRLRETSGAALSDIRVRSSGVALSVEGGDGVVVRGGSLEGGRAAVRAVDGHAVVLDGVATTGQVRGATVADPPAADAAGTGPATTSSWRPVEGAGAVTLLVLVGATVLEAARSRRRWWRRGSLPSG